MKTLISCIAVVCLFAGCGDTQDSALSTQLEPDLLELPGPSFYPENLHAAADGTIYVGSLGTGEVVRFSPGSTLGSVFLPAGTVKSVSGVRVDETTHSLLVCAVDAQFQTVPTVNRYDLQTGKLLATYRFPNAGSNPYVAFPNDLTFDGERNLYVSDSFGHIYVLPAKQYGADATLAVWSSDPLLAPANTNAFGADGITWDGSGSLYVNNNDTGSLVRIPIGPGGTASPAVAITVTPALSHPDGMRQLDANTLVVVDNAGSLEKLTLSGDRAGATAIANQLDAPTGVVKVGDAYWVSEGQITTSLLTGAEPRLPFSVRRVTAY